MEDTKATRKKDNVREVFEKYKIQIPLFFCFLLYLSPCFYNNTVVGEGIDLFGSFWFYWWVEAFLGQEPSVLFFYPYGKDVFAHTGNNLIDAYLSIPFQWLFGFPNYQPIFILFLFVLNSIALQRWLSLFTNEKWVLLCVIVITLFSPYFLWELSCGRSTQFVIFPALLSLEAMEHLRRDTSVKWAFLAGFFAAIQGWTYWFYGYFLGFFLILYVIYHIREFRFQIKNMIVALGTCLVCIGPAVALMFDKLQRQEIPGLDATPVYELLFSYTPWEPLGIPFFSFFSITMSGLVLFFTPQRKLLVGWLVVSLLVTSGGRGSLFGEDVSFWHYEWLSQYLPFFSRLWFPYRMLAFTQITLATGMVLFLRKKHVIAVLFFMGVHFYQLYDYRMLPVVQTSMYSGQAYENRLMEGAIIELPIGFAKPTITHQILHQRPVLGGMGENIKILQPIEHQDRLQKDPYKKLRSLHREKALSDVEIQKLIQDGFSYLVLDKSVLFGVLRHRKNGYKNYIDVLIRDFGSPCYSDTTIILWELQRECEKNKGKNFILELYDVDPIVPSSFEKKLREKERIPK